MFNLNNKGQSLVLFVILFPIFILVMAMVYDIGNFYYEKERLDNVNYMTIEYGLDEIENINESDLIDLIVRNTSNLSDISVLIDDDVITIRLGINAKGIFSTILNFDSINISSEYKGSIINDEKIIERVK